MQITTVLTNAQPRVVNKRDGSGSFTLYELFDHEGTAWVVKQDVYNQWAHAIGSTVDMVVRVEQNGQWTNRFADLISPSSGAVPASNAALMAMQAAAQAQRVQPSMQPAQPAQMGWQQQGGAMVPTGGMAGMTGMAPQTTQSPPQPQLQDVSVYPTKKDSAIARQTAAKVAAEISTSPTEFWANCVDLARYFDSGTLPMNAQQAGPTASPDQQYAGMAAAGQGYSNTPPPPTNDDIPF